MDCIFTGNLFCWTLGCSGQLRHERSSDSVQLCRQVASSNLRASCEFWSERYGTCSTPLRSISHLRGENTLPQDMHIRHGTFEGTSCDMMWRNACNSPRHQSFCKSCEHSIRPKLSYFILFFSHKFWVNKSMNCESQHGSVKNGLRACYPRGTFRRAPRVASKNFIHDREI